MSKIVINDLQDGSYKEVSFSYKGLRFVYKYISTQGWDDGSLIDLNKDNKLSESEFNELESVINNLDLNDLSTGDEIEFE